LVFVPQTPPGPAIVPVVDPEDEFVKVAVRAPVEVPGPLGRKLLIVVTVDGEKYVVVDVGSANSGLAIREMILTAVSALSWTDLLCG
jgi:hypothetical protein